MEDFFDINQQNVNHSFNRQKKNVIKKKGSHNITQTKCFSFPTARGFSIVKIYESI